MEDPSGCGKSQSKKRKFDDAPPGFGISEWKRITDVPLIRNFDDPSSGCGIWKRNFNSEEFEQLREKMISYQLAQNPCVLGSQPSSVAMLYKSHSQITPGRHMEDAAKDMAMFAISTYNKHTANAEYEVERVEEVSIKYKELPVYLLTFTAKDCRAGRRDTFEAKAWESKNNPTEVPTIVEYCRIIKPTKEAETFRVRPAKPPPTRKVTFQSHSEWLSQFEERCRESLGSSAGQKPSSMDDPLEIQIQEAAATASSYYPTVLHDNPVAVVDPVKPDSPRVRKLIFRSQSEIFAGYKKNWPEASGFYADIQPCLLLCFGGGGGPVNPDEIRAAREDNYLKMAKLAISYYNKDKMETEFEVEQVQKANVKSKESLCDFVYDLTFTAKDVRATAVGLETFEAAVRVFLGNPETCKRFTVEFCSKSI